MVLRSSCWRAFGASSFGGLVVALAVACGDDANVDSSGPPDGAVDGDAATDDVVQTEATTQTGSDVDAFCEGTLGLYAPMYEDCCDPAAAPKRYAFDTAVLKAVVLSCTTTLGKSIASGRAAFVAAEAATCQASVSASVQARTCPEVHRTPSNQPVKSLFHEAAGCSGALVGRQGVDAPCASDYECLDGLTCIGWTLQSDGVCRTPPAEAAPCGYAIPDGGGVIDLMRWGFGVHPRCAEGFYCASTALQQGTCRASKLTGDDCNSDDECASGLRCQVGVCGTAGPAPVDAPCERDSDCQDRLYCRRADGGRRCAPREVAGTPCTSTLGSECQGACVEPDGGAGATCVSFCGSL